MPTKRILPVLVLLLIALRAPAETLDLGLHGTFTIAVPKGWKYSVQKEEDTGMAITLSPPDNVNARCLVNLVYVPKPEPITKERVQEEVLTVCDQFVDASVEKKKVLREFTVGGGALGSYCVFTDASLVGQPSKRDEFKVIGIGIIRFNEDLMGAISIAGDDEKGADFAAMIAAVSSTAVTPKK